MPTIVGVSISKALKMHDLSEWVMTAISKARTYANNAN
jgi:hypothetical protein